MLEDKLIVFYDGDCGFCNYWVMWILKNDKHDKFRFAALQSEMGQSFLTERGLSTEQLNTLYLWKPTQFYLQKSKAVFQIAKELGGIYSLLAIFSVLPTFITDSVYDSVAKRRKQLSNNTCQIPSPEERKKFIS